MTRMTLSWDPPAAVLLAASLAAGSVWAAPAANLSAQVTGAPEVSPLLGGRLSIQLPKGAQRSEVDRLPPEPEATIAASQIDFKAGETQFHLAARELHANADKDLLAQANATLQEPAKDGGPFAFSKARLPGGLKGVWLKADTSTPAWRDQGVGFARGLLLEHRDHTLSELFLTANPQAAADGPKGCKQLLTQAGWPADAGCEGLAERLIQTLKPGRSTLAKGGRRMAFRIPVELPQKMVFSRWMQGPTSIFQAETIDPLKAPRTQRLRIYWGNMPKQTPGKEETRFWLGKSLIWRSGLGADGKTLWREVEYPWGRGERYLQLRLEAQTSGALAELDVLADKMQLAPLR